MEGNLILVACLILVAAKLALLDYCITLRTGRNPMLLGKAVIAALILAAAISIIP